MNRFLLLISLLVGFGLTNLYGQTTCNNEKGYNDFPFTENGLTVTASGTGGYLLYAGAFSSCDVTTKQNSVYIGSSPSTFTNTFSASVNDMVYNITAAGDGEVVTITTNNGTPSITYIDGTCPADLIISSNVITLAPGTNSSGGRIKVTSPNDFTEVTFSHNGAANGLLMTMCFDAVFNSLSPSVTTQAVSSIASTTATGNGNITDLGVPDPTAHGVCWGTSTGPTISGSHTDEGATSSTGAFTSSMTGLTANTLYYVRAYATNTAGTSYGDEVTFTTSAASTGTAIVSFSQPNGLQYMNGTDEIAAFDFTMPVCTSYDLSELGININSASDPGVVKLAIYDSNWDLLYQTPELTVTGGTDEYVSHTVTTGSLTLSASTTYRLTVIGDPGSGSIKFDAEDNPTNTGTATSISGSTRRNYTGTYPITYPTFPDPNTPLINGYNSYRTFEGVVRGVATTTTFTVGSISASQSIPYNTAPNELTGVAPTGGNTPYTYQWQDSPNGSTWTNIGSATSLDYQPPTLTSTTYYRLNQTSSGGCGTLPTNTVTITVADPQIDLITEKSVDNATPVEGATIVYTIDVSNPGSQTYGYHVATNVSLTDVLPTGVTYVSHTGDGTYNSGTGLWTIGSINDEGSKSIDITATVDASTAGTTITNNTTAATGDQSDPTTTGDVLSAAITVGNQIDLITEKSVDNTTPVEGATIVYTIDVSNPGSQTYGYHVATNVSLTDVLPTGVTYVSHTGDGTYNSGTGLWTIGSINDEGSKSIDITATVDASTAGTTITNNTTAATGDQSDPTTTGDVLSAAITVGNQIDLITEKSVDNETPVEGSTIVYTIDVSNPGSSTYGYHTATNVSLTDILPSGVTYVSHTADQGTYNSTTGVWDIGSIFDEGTESIEITATVNAGTAETTITNTTTAAAGDQSDPTTSGDVLSADITVGNQIDLITEKSVDNSTPVEGSTIVYTIDVSNPGSQTYGYHVATNVSLTDVLPTGVTYVSHTGDGTYNSGTGLWTIGSINDEGSKSIDITATVDASTAGTTITNNTTAATGDQSDPTTSGDVLSADITVGNQIDLITEKSVDNETPVEGATIVYTIDVINPGSQTYGYHTATNVSLTDILPSGVTYVSHTADQGTYNSTTGVWDIGSIFDEGTESIEITATVDAGTAETTITNTTTAAAGDQSDPTTSSDVLSADITVTVATPDIQASYITFPDVQNNQMTINWTSGNGEKRVVYSIQVAPGGLFSAMPVDGSTYTANPIFGNGTQIGETGWYCVYNGTGNSTTITGLTPNINYRFMVCEYNGAPGEEFYNRDIEVGNPNEIQAVPLSDWAIYIGILLMIGLVVFRNRKRLALK